MIVWFWFSIAKLLLFGRVDKFSPTSTLLHPKTIIRFYYYDYS